MWSDWNGSFTVIISSDYARHKNFQWFLGLWFWGFVYNRAKFNDFFFLHPRILVSGVCFAPNFLKVFYSIQWFWLIFSWKWFLLEDGLEMGWLGLGMLKYVIQWRKSVKRRPLLFCRLRKRQKQAGGQRVRYLGFFYKTWEKWNGCCKLMTLICLCRLF